MNGDDSRFGGVSVRAWIAVVLVMTVCLMSASGIDVKEPLYTLATVGVGYYFGQKTQSKPTP